MQPLAGEPLALFQPILALTMDAQPFSEGLNWLTSSIFVAALVCLLILFFCRKATKNVQRVPSGTQNFVELVIEFLYGQVEGIVGKKIAPRAFPLLATIFIFVLISNWFGLMPGVGTVGFGPKSGFLTLDTSYQEEVVEETLAEEASGEVEVPLVDELALLSGEDVEGHGDHANHVRPLLRPSMADLNMTLAIAFVFMIVWFWLTMTEMGFIGFLKHTFAPKGGLTGLMGTLLIPIFLFVGIIELVSIAFRPMSLSLRLFGNVFAGESLLHTMSSIGNGWGPIGSFVASVVLPLPFYFLELLVGVLQAMVFALLCAVYIQLSTTHDEDH